MTTITTPAATAIDTTPADTATATGAAATVETTGRRALGPVWKAGAPAGIVAAAAATGVAALGHLAGASLEVTGAPGEPIPYLGFAQLTLMCTALGLVVASVLARTASRPARTFARVAFVLTVVSCLPSAAMGADVATKVTLVLTHLVAAAIVVPAVRHALDR